MRDGFSMITAIFVMLIMASIGAIVMSISGKIVKSTVAQYQYEQAVLYAKSYTEFAVMAVSANDRVADDCLETIKGDIGDDPENGNGYRIRTHISYIGNDTGNCAATRRLNLNPITTANTPLTIIIDAYVDYRDPDNTNQWRTVHRRTVQKI